MTLKSVVADLLGLIDKIIPVIVLLGLVMFLWLCVRYIMSPGEQGGQRRGAIVWGLISLFVILSFWGIITTIQNTFLGGGTTSSNNSSEPPIGGLF